MSIQQPIHAAHSALEIARPASTRLFDWLAALASGWIIAGLYLDLWAHSNGFADTTFFTPWHAVLYSGLLATTLVLLAGSARNVLAGYHWMNATPAGYALALLGAVVFALGGLSDATWHTLLGIETSIEALLSPPHLLLAVGAFLLLGGPLAAAWGRGTLGERMPLPALLSLLWLLAVLDFFSQYAHPLVEPLVNLTDHGWRNGALGVSAFLLQSAVLAGVALYALRRWQLPFGALALLCAVPALLLGVVNGTYALALGALAGGLLADLAALLLRPGPQRPWAARTLGVLLPLCFFGCYMAGFGWRHALRWPPAMWAGTLFLCAAVGGLLALLAFPPALPTAPGEE